VTDDGWFRTGDLLTCDADGYLYVVGRLTHMIIRGGANIAPAEVERALTMLPAVADAMVFGLPDPAKGEAVVAAVVLTSGAVASPDQLIEAVSVHLAKYKVPQHLVVVESIPTGATGKRDRNAMRDLVASTLPAHTRSGASGG
jgi:long-chain acyl-CoA synthetase